jgi:hypothetical protein
LARRILYIYTIFVKNIFILYIKRMHNFALTFSLSIIPLNKFAYKNVIFFVAFEKIKIYIIVFDILLVSLKKMSIVCLFFLTR